MSSTEYYPTKCELEILQKHSSDFCSFLSGSEFNLIELGAGDGTKTKILVKELLAANKKINYMPIDISKGALVSLMELFQNEFQDLSVKPVAGEYFNSLNWIRTNVSGRNIVLFLGSNIGNFNRPRSEVFLKTLWNTLNDGDYVLLGADLKKDIDVMLWAYNDRQGHTRDFNLNLLTRINRELGANFDISKFRHFGTYNVKLGAMESFLISTESQEVYIEYLNKTFCFDAFEPIHVEFSFKYLLTEIEELAKNTGFEVEKYFTDQKKYFTDFLLRVVKK